MAKMVTSEIRFAYVRVFEAHSMNGQPPKFSICLIIRKSDIELVKRIQRAIAEAEQEGAQKFWGGKIPKNLKSPLRDGAEREDQPEFEDCYFINANSLQRPELVDENLNHIIDQSEFYSGCYGRASINFYPFSINGNRGIACGLNNIQKLRDGEALTGRTRAVDDFAD